MSLGQQEKEAHGETHPVQPLPTLKTLNACGWHSGGHKDQGDPSEGHFGMMHNPWLGLLTCGQVASADHQDVLGMMAVALPEGEGSSGAVAPTCPTLRHPQACLPHASPHDQQPGRKHIHCPPCAACSHLHPGSPHCGAPAPIVPPGPLPWLLTSSTRVTVASMHLRRGLGSSLFIHFCQAPRGCLGTGRGSQVASVSHEFTTGWCVNEHACVCEHVCECVNVCECVCLCVHVHAHVSACTCVCFVRTHVSVLIHVWECVWLQT